jgi:adenylate cyclase
MALWGAPLARDDDTDRATQAALAMQRRLEQINRDSAGNGRPTLGIGIGIDVGEVFAGNIGSERRLEYTVIGDAVNTAARLCAEASPGEVLISESLYRALATPPPVDVLAPLQLKGKTQPVPVYRVDWKEDQPTPPAGGPTDATTTSGTIPFRQLLETQENEVLR